MKNLLLLSMTALILSLTPVAIVAQDSSPNPGALKLVAQLPPELPQRVMGFAFDGEKLWATVYHGEGRYATLDPTTLTWNAKLKRDHDDLIGRVANRRTSPGGICFGQGKLWMSGSYGVSIASIDTQTLKVEELVNGKRLQDHSASQSYASIAFDGNYLWVVWHWFRYNLPLSQTQLLLKVDSQSGEVLAEYPAPGGTRNDVTHGLAWDGTRLWHIKNNRLSSIDPVTGLVTARYRLDHLNRPSGLAWVKNSLWIVEFDGKVWQLPFGT